MCNVICRFKTLDEVELWKTRLTEWKDFCVDYGMIYPKGIANHDLERGSDEGLMLRSSSVSNPSNNTARTNYEFENIQVSYFTLLIFRSSLYSFAT